MLRPRGQPCSRLEATKPFWPLPSLCPVERSCRSRSHVPGRTQWVQQCLHGPRKPPLGWLLSPSALEQSHCVVPGAWSSTCRGRRLKERTRLGASSASPTDFGAETQGPVSGAFGWTPVLHSLWGPLAVGTPQAWPRGARRRMAASTSPLPGAALGTAGAQVLWCFTRDRFLSPPGCHWGSWPHWCILPTLGSVCPGRAWPWALALSPRQQCHCRGTWGRQRGISQGISHAGTSCFSPLPLPMSLTLKSLTLPSSLPSPLAFPITGHCCSSATFLLCPLPRHCCPDTCSSVSSPVREPPALGSYSWVSWVVLGEGLLHPRMALEAGSGVALRYEVGTVRVGAGTAWQRCPGQWGGKDGLQSWDWQCHWPAVGTPSASSAPPFCRGSCCLVTHRDHGWCLQLSTICSCAQRVRWQQGL